MPSVIRTGAFETNSSSTHSLSLIKRKNQYYPDYRGQIVTLHPYELDTSNGEITISGFLFKAEYLLTVCIHIKNSQEYEDSMLDFFQYVLEDCTGGTFIFDIPTDPFYADNSEHLHRKVFESRETLEDFLFGDSSVTVDYNG